MGRIADSAKSNIPVSWDIVMKDARAGDSVLTARENYINNLVLGLEPDQTTEDALHPLVVEYLGKRLALDVVQVAIDIVMELSEMESTQQPVELTRYESRLKNMQEKKKNLLVELAELEPVIIGLIPNLSDRRSASAPRLSSIDDDLLTPNPQDLGPIYAPLETGA